MEQQRKDPVAWQMDLLKKDYLLFDQLADRSSRKIVLTDTSFIETVVFAARAGIEMGPAVESWIQTKRYFKSTPIAHCYFTRLNPKRLTGGP